MDKITEYLHNERQSQFSDEKRTEIEETKVGHSHMSEGLQNEFENALKIAKNKNTSVKTCLWCGHPAFVRNTFSHSAPLCENCEGARPELERRLKNTKSMKILPGDAIKIANARTKRTGPFFNPKEPNKFINITTRPTDKHL